MEVAGFRNVGRGIDSMFVLGMIVFIHFIHSSDFRKYKTVSFTIVAVFTNLIYCFFKDVSNDLNSRGLLSPLS